jgi:hypothetical protein
MKPLYDKRCQLSNQQERAMISAPGKDAPIQADAT